ncbi:MAG: magnesium and cobalt transport protein CorA [Solirubrobacterales bacterium]
MIVDCAHYEGGVRQQGGPMSVAEAADRAAEGDGFVWLRLHEPTEAEMREVAEAFPVHERAIEDASSRHRRAKLEDYEDHYFVVLRTARYDDPRERVEFGEIHIFAAPGYAITVRHGEASELASARARLEARPDLVRAGPVSVVWAVLDTVVDDYVPVVQGLTEDVEDAEVRVFEGGGDQIERIYALKREAIEFHRSVHPLLAPLAAIERGADPRVTGMLQDYFRDINDHVKLVHDEIGSQRELLTSILQANLALLGARQNEISVQQNETSKQLTMVATIFLPLSFITGFFGMNFPWLVDHIGSFGAFAVWGVGSLLLSCAALYAWFRRSRYL